MQNQVIIPPHRSLSLVQMFGIIVVANTAVKMLANRPPAPIVKTVVQEITEARASQS